MTIKLTINQELLEVASHVVWFKEPKNTLSNPTHFLAYLMTYGLPDDIAIVKKYVTTVDFIEALEHAPPGIIDSRSWAYWNVICDRIPIPPMPKRFS